MLSYEQILGELNMNKDEASGLLKPSDLMKESGDFFYLLEAKIYYH
jgi:hypothetical protein